MFAKAGEVAAEGVDTVRTVVANNLNYTFLDRYSAEVDKPFKSSLKISQTMGLGFGLGEFFTFMTWAIAFSYGSYLVDEGECDFTEMMRVRVLLYYVTHS